MTDYAWSVDLPVTHDVAIERATAALAAQGFGVLTRIDVHEVLARKIGVQRDPYVILGACNPNFAHQVLQAEPAMGILLPCNVVVEARGRASRVWITRPEALFTLTGRDDVAPVAAEVSRRLEAVAEALRGVEA